MASTLHCLIALFSPTCLRLIKRRNTATEETQGLGVRFIMLATWGDKAKHERFDLKV